MKKQLYSMYDTKAKAYGNPWTAVNDDVAIRSVRQMFNGQQNEQLAEMKKYGEDYNLVYVGEWDDETALLKKQDIKILGTIKSIMEGTIQ